MSKSATIITSVRNCLEETRVFLDSLFSHEPANLAQVIVVDDGSEKETENFLRSLKDSIQLVRNDKSIGFGPANNLGVEHSQSDWLLFMNNDLVLTKDWAKPFETVMNGQQKLNQLGCLGNVQLDPRTKKIDHAGITFAKGYPSHYLQGEENLPHEGFSEYLAVTGACFLIRKDLFCRTGGFDQAYKTGFEDIDFCLKLRLLGYKHYVANESKIWHKRSSTPERNDHQAHNSKVFYGRWGKIMTRLEEWGRTNASTSQHRKKQYARILEKPQSFLFADRDLLMQNFQFHLRNRMWKESKKVLKLLKENFGGDADLILLESQLLRKSNHPSKAKALLNKKGNDSSTSSFLLEEAFVRKALGEMTSARRKFLSLAKKGFIPGVCLQKIGECYLEEKKFEEAKKYYKKALIHLPDSFRIWNLLAQVSQELGEKSNEIKALQKSLSLNPQNSSTLFTLFQSLVGLGSWTKAYQLCIRSKGMQIPIEHLLDFSKACIESGDIRSAIISLNKLISKRHNVAEAYFLKGNVMVLLKEFSRAVECYRKALDYREDWPEALSNLYNSKTFLCDWSERKKEIKQLQAFHQTGSILGGAFELAGLHWSEDEESKYARIRSDKIVAETETIRRRLNFDYNLQERTKKRIGFLSSDFRNHAVGHQMIALLENLDAEKYEIFLYASNPSVDSEIRKRFVALNENFRDVSNLSLAAKARCINHDKLDLLVDLGGFSRGHNAEVLALRPSARQAHYLGYASSMGKGLVDYMIADRFVIPPKSSKDFGEKIIRMDGCFFPPGDFEGFAKRSRRKEVGLPSRGFVYCAFHAAYKLEPEIWASWMRILRSVPESVLWLKFKPSEEALKNLRSEAVRQGVSSKRIIMAEDMPVRSSHLSRMTVADLYLDCPKYNGHASAMDALHAKLPILTIKGNRFCNRVGESFCRNLGLGEMVSNELKQYEKKAIELGLRPSRLLPLRKKIQENVDSVLSPVAHAQRFQQAMDQILSKRVKYTKNNRLRGNRSQVSVNVLPKLEDFSLVMIRPLAITNWASNVNFLAEELAKLGGRTIVIEPDHPDHKKGDFSKHVKRLPQFGGGFAEAMNYALTNISTNFVLFLDDPLRALPANHFIEVINQAKETLSKGKIGVLGIGSSMEPNTGVLVTKGGDAATKKVAGLFAPSFALNLEGMRLTGGFRTFGTTAVLSCLDLSLRLEEQGWKSVLIETEKLLCPASSGKDYLHEAGKQAIAYFGRIWKRKPVSLNPKFPPKEEQVGETADYQEWIRLCDTITEGDILSFRKDADELRVKPLISVVMPVFDPSKKFLIKAIESVLTQAYENWELCIADDASTKKYIRPLLESYARKDSRIKVTFRKTNGHISVASNSALKLATGEFVAFLDHDDELRPHSLLEVVKVINLNPNAQLIYSDEDKVDEHGHRYDPYFKPDWNPDLLLGQNYISHFSVFEVALLRKLKGLRKGYEGSQDWDLTLRFTEHIKYDCILHVSKILYHWRAIKGSAALSQEEKKYAAKAGMKALKDCLRRRQINGKIEPVVGNWFRVKRTLPKILPKVSILIPIRDKIDLLKICIASIRRTVSYPHLEILILNNDSEEDETKDYLEEINQQEDIKVLNIEGKFNFSRLNNIGAQKASGELLLMLNNDTEAMQKNWLEEMIVHAVRNDIGCVGARLLNPDNTIQHGGVVFGHYGGGIHAFRNLPMKDARYNGHLQLDRNYSAITAACLMVKKKIFLNLGGLNETNFAVSYNDTDFCLRIQNSGLYNLFTAQANLYHLESVSRGSDLLPQNMERATKERNCQHRIWFSIVECDPQYNVNLSRHFEDFSHFRFIKNLPHQNSSIVLKKSFKNTVSTSAENKKRLVEQTCSINIFGFFRQDFGLARAGKCIALGLKEAGETYDAFQLPYKGGHKNVDPLYRCNSNPPKDLRKINIFCCNGDYTKQFVPHWLEEKNLRQGYNVGYWHWEMPYFPEVFESHFNLLDEIWVPSSFTAQSIGKKSMLPLQVIPYPIDIPKKIPHLEYIPFRFPSGSFVLLTAFDFMSSVERKNPVAVIEAFSESIRHVPNLHLAIKTVNHDGFPKARNELRMALSEIPPDRYTIIDDTLSRNELLSLFSQANAFISLHRAEGFGMMMAEAMTLGLPVIATAWSANMEFMTNSNSYPVKYSLKPNRKNDGPYHAGIPWAEADVKHTIEQILRCVTNVQERQIIASRGQTAVKKLFSTERLKVRIRDRISLIKKRLEKNNRVRFLQVSKVNHSNELGEEKVSEVIDRLRESIGQRK